MLELIEKIYAHQDLSKEQCSILFKEIIKGKMDPIIQSSLLTGLKMKGESFAEIAGAASALLDEASLFPANDYELGDIVGTGGDKSNSINVSTLATFVAAGLGIKMAKHGNRSVSSRCGSFDLLEALGIPFNVEIQKLKENLDTHGICFLYAPLFHAGIRYVMPVRKTLKTKTIFNILGPLINPARPTFQLVGVYSAALLEPVANALVLLGLTRGMVVYGNGMDEIAPHAETQIIEINHGRLEKKVLSPASFGISSFSVEHIAGGEKQENLEISLRILSGNGSEWQKKMIAMNVAPIIVMSDKAKDLKSATGLAMDILNTGAPLKLAQQMKEQRA